MPKMMFIIKLGTRFTGGIDVALYQCRTCMKIEIGTKSPMCRCTEGKIKPGMVLRCPSCLADAEMVLNLKPTDRGRYIYKCIRCDLEFELRNPRVLK